MELSIDVPVVDEQIDGLHDVVAGVRPREEEKRRRNVLAWIRRTVVKLG